MQVILLENMRNLGKFGAMVNVANGFGRNYLIPLGKAVPATKLNRAKFEADRANLEKAAQSRLQAAQARAAEINNLEITLEVRAGDEGKLYGSVGTIELAHALKEKGLQITRQEIRLPNGPLRELGVYEIDLQLHAEVLAKAHFILVPEAKK